MESNLGTVLSSATPNSKSVEKRRKTAAFRFTDKHNDNTPTILFTVIVSGTCENRYKKITAEFKIADDKSKT